MNTFLSVNDGRAVFPVRVLAIEAGEKKAAVRDALANVQVEGGRVVCYTEEEAGRAEAVLKDLGIAFTDVTAAEAPDQAIRDKAAGVMYASRTECIEHLRDGKEPKSAEEQAFRRKLNEMVERLAVLESRRG